MFVVVVYDVNEKRIQHIEKFLSRYLHHVQNSVFEGDLTKKEINALEKGVLKIISRDQDSVRIYVFESRDSVTTTSLGSQESPSAII